MILRDDVAAILFLIFSLLVQNGDSRDFSATGSSKLSIPGRGLLPICVNGERLAQEGLNAVTHPDAAFRLGLMSLDDLSTNPLEATPSGSLVPQ